MTQPVAAEVQGGSMDCGSGLLLMLTRAIRQIEFGQLLLVHTEEPSVPPDLHEWARLAGHEIVSDTATRTGGPWQVTIRRGTVTGLSSSAAGPVFTGGSATPVGQRLWLYSNFHCNLACDYCCAESSPRADPRLLSVKIAVTAAEEFAAMGGQELIVTGGEPFLHPEIGPLIIALAGILPVTILTNAMVFGRGARLAALVLLPRDRVTLQVSLDSASPALHERHRGVRSHAAALAGVAQARDLGFTVKVAATLYDSEVNTVADLNALLDTMNIPVSDRIIRPVAQQGSAEQGEHVHIDTLQPEPTLTADGVWWHPVAVTDPTMRVANSPLPVSEALDTIRDTLTTQNAAQREGRRHVFRCA